LDDGRENEDARVLSYQPWRFVYEVTKGGLSGYGNETLKDHLKSSRKIDT
jgi:hypothetical protein